MSKVCQCPHPPGGHIICEDHQFGMCAYKDGKKVGGCLNIPDAIARLRDAEERKQVLTNWVLSQITETVRTNYQSITDDEMNLLRSGEFTSRSGHVVRFSLPEMLDLDNAPSAGVAAMS